MCTTERQRGVTLIELIVFIVIVGAAIAGVLAVFNQVTKSSADPLIRKQAIAVAESLMEELRSAYYSCPPGATCNTVNTTNRAEPHALDDYNGFAMSGILAIDGTAITHLAGYDASIGVVDAALNGRNGKRITITASRGAESVTLEGWRGQY